MSEKSKVDEDLISDQEYLESEKMEQKIQELNKKLSSFKSFSNQFNLTPTQEQQIIDPQNAPELNIDDIPTLDRRGNKVLSNSDVWKNYHDSLPFFNFFQLPYCKKSIKTKAQFWGVMSFFIAYFLEAKKQIELRKGLKGVTWRPLGRKYLFISAFGISFSLIESIFFEDYCNINSIHYAQDLNRRKLIEDVKKKFKNS